MFPISMKKAKATFSTRASILEFVLTCINSNLYDDQGDYMIFGSDLEGILEGAKRPEDLDALRESISDFKTQIGRQYAARRTSLEKVPELKLPKNAERLSPETINAILEVLKKENEEGTTFSTKQQRDALIEQLDAHYAQEVLKKLEKIVRRASGLQSLDPRGISDQDVLKYFEEAHRCFLYGFRIAAAVLCRAILESALRKIVDPDGKIERRVPRGKSYFEALVSSARLTDDRPGWAIRVRDAGNDAIHRLEKFDREYPGSRASEIVDNTRKVLLDLYGSTRLAELD